MKRILGWFYVLTALSTALVWAESDSLTNRTILVPMRDSVRLATDVHLPPGTNAFPVILVRTPYGRTNIGNMATDATKRGYALVVQDTRGRFGSEGENIAFEGDGWATHWDGYDTVEWVARQPWCNGKIGTFGGSALGIAQLLMAGAGTPKVACQHITVGAPSLYRDTVYNGGVFRKALIEDWLRLSRFSPDNLKLWTSHPALDAFWREREICARYDHVNQPAVHIGGWYDIFAQGTLDAFVGYQTLGGPKARGHQKLIMGPWTHGVLQDKAGELRFPNAKKPPGEVHDAWRWFDYYLKGIDNHIEDAPAVTYYVMGDVSDTNAPGNVWRSAKEWPIPGSSRVRFYLQDDRSLSSGKPGRGRSLAYTYDPKDPAPTVGGVQLTIPAGPMDQRKLEARPDVLVFTSAPLADPVEMTGRVRARLWASSDCPDTDFMVKLCDVYPDGRSFNICEGRLRARYRESLSTEKLLQPGRPALLDIDLWSTSIVFNKGHQMRVQVTSSSSPGFDPNPNTGDPFRANDKTQVAHNTLYTDGQHASYIELPLMLSGGR